MKKIFIVSLLCLVLTGCGKAAKPEETKKSSSKTHSSSTVVSSETSTTKSTTEKSTETTISSTEDPEVKRKRETLEAYNNLPLEIKVLMATAIVDPRAEAQGLQGFTLTYHFEGDQMLVNIHSGAGSGHPWYLLRYDDEFIYPLDGVVNQGPSKQEAAPVDQTPISKIDLYEKYQANKEHYDQAVANIKPNEEMTLEKFQERKARIGLEEDQ